MDRPTRRSILAGLLSVGAVAEDAEPYDVDEAYEIYSTLIPKEWAVRVAKAKRLVILAECVVPRLCAQDLDEARGEDLVAAVADYRRLSVRRLRLLRKLRLDRPYEYVPNEKIDAYFRERGPNGWDDFYRAYPNSGGYIALAAVGFNPSKTVAVTNVSHSCGGVCGGGEFHFLRKTNGEWTRITGGTRCAWFS